MNAIGEWRGLHGRLVCAWRMDIGRRYCWAHSHDVVELVYHMRGAGVTTLGDGRRIEFAPHGTVLYPAGVRHDQRMSSRGEDICLHLELPRSATELRRLTAEAIYVPPDPPDDFVRGEFVQLSQAGYDPGRRLELGLRVTALLLRLLNLNQSVKDNEPPDLAERYVDRARQYIRENYARIENVGEIARYVGVSEDYLRHLFAEREAVSLTELITECRIERAKELLRHSRLPLKEIAALCGYQTDRYLSARFKALAGCAPGAFRRQTTG